MPSRNLRFRSRGKHTTMSCAPGTLNQLTRSLIGPSRRARQLLFTLKLNGGFRRKTSPRFWGCCSIRPLEILKVNSERFGVAAQACMEDFRDSDLAENSEPYPIQRWGARLTDETAERSSRYRSGESSPFTNSGHRISEGRVGSGSGRCSLHTADCLRLLRSILVALWRKFIWTSLGCLGSTTLTPKRKGGLHTRVCRSPTRWASDSIIGRDLLSC
jgi:hypothetical protein